jgi:hypothetical protein
MRSWRLRSNDNGSLWRGEVADLRDSVGFQSLGVITFSMNNSDYTIYRICEAMLLSLSLSL